MTDEALDEEFEGDRAELLAMRADFDDACNKMVELGGGKLHFLGEKPAPGDNVYLIDLPDSSVIIRLSDGGLERGHQFLLDFVDRDSRKPDHMPQSYAIWRLYNGPCSPAMHQLMSWEAAMGMPEDQIAPGEQRFSVIEGVTYRVEYLGATPVEFTVPERPRAGPAVHIVPLATTAK
ncbi:uncharacterized protein B0H18DRAFT_881682 [Fomitopsis serialis]|uniref:uncharacterized protein n=1 Tax=Fomitopsis serialis TaxID=139415 RepID=UPI0020088FF7|nr:uncharacterized protein B0H18DRAFT_881682 [Neoantrodia serialis]KAH9919718.1 hypothetical protein B0H18DRAFT_881682 [Neoantrodia serialis]